VHRGSGGVLGPLRSAADDGGRTLAWLKVKMPHYREGERGWEPKG
jgi:hypothetical protein